MMAAERDRPSAPGNDTSQSDSSPGRKDKVLGVLAQSAYRYVDVKIQIYTHRLRHIYINGYRYGWSWMTSSASIPTGPTRSHNKP